MIGILDKAASMSTADAAAVLARVAAAARESREKAAIVDPVAPILAGALFGAYLGARRNKNRRSVVGRREHAHAGARPKIPTAGQDQPLTKAADPSVLRNLAIGAGVGGAGMGLAGLLQGKRRKSVLRNALMGAGLGAGVGGLYSAMPEIGKANDKEVTPPAEQLRHWNAKYPATREFQRLLGLGVPDNAPDVPFLGEIIPGGLGGARAAGDVLGLGSGGGAGGGVSGGGAGAAAGPSLGGRLGGLIANNPVTAAASGLGVLHEGNQRLLAHRMRPIAETHIGLQDMFDKATDPARKSQLQAQLEHIAKSFGRPSGLGLRPAVGYGFRAFNAGSSSLIDAARARAHGESLLGSNPSLLTNSRFGALYGPRRLGLKAKALGPILARFVAGG